MKSPNFANVPFFVTQPPSCLVPASEAEVGLLETHPQPKPRHQVQGFRQAALAITSRAG